MDKPLQTELRLSDVSHFCLCLAKSCGGDLVEGPVDGKWNMERLACAQGEACNARVSARQSYAGLRHGLGAVYMHHLYSYALNPKIIAV